MGLLASIFGSRRLQPKIVIKSVLGETLLELPVRDLVGSTCLRGRDLSHADLRGLELYGADLENAILFGADLRNCDFARCNLKNANLAYARVDGADFRRSDLDGVDLLHTGIRLTQLDRANITSASTIPGIRVVL